MTDWIRAPAGVLTIAQELIEDHYEHLEGAGIGFVFRDEAPASNGKFTLAKASVVPAHMRPYVDFEFMIWIAEDKWMEANDLQRRAIIDQQLCRCVYKDVTPVIRPWEIEEFPEILERYGLWNGNLWDAKAAMQTALQISLPGFEARQAAEALHRAGAKLYAIEPSEMELSRGYV